jgi:hypothetical protein
MVPTTTADGGPMTMTAPGHLHLPPTWRHQVAEVLRGRRGLTRAVPAWVALLTAVALLASVLTWISLPLMVGVTVVCSLMATSRSRTTARWPRRVVTIALLVGSIAFAFAWWVAGVTTDGADNAASVPPAADWGGAALLVLAGSGVALVVALLGALLARPHPA